ncbi:DNA ligase 1-like [Nematostella vectensis]|uniref:DNA ligase 1-like n=1 Tax=Nematostella vectensis TaxID=45351 RepID=UPI002077739B|nr:DNA ligase 1-like [Nematostella vectensis]
MTDELQEKELENDRQYQTIVDLKDELKSLTASAKEMKQNQNESEELAACRSELEKAKEEIEKARASYDKEKDRLEKLNKEMTDELKEKELENDRQYQTIIDLKDELKSLTASAKEMKQNQNESEELAACRSELEKAKEEIEKARASYDKEKDRLEKLNKEMTDELQEKELENDRQYQTIVDLKDELKSLTASAKEMKQNQNESEELAACRSELEEAKEEIEKAWALYDKEKDRLEKLNRQMTDELQEKELENDRQYQTIVDLKDELKSLTASHKEMKQNQNGSEELAACRSELEKAREEIEKAWALYDKEKDRLEKLNRQMTDELQEKELENDRQYQTIVDLKDELKSLTASQKEMKQNQNGSEELDACRSELEKAKEEIEKARASYDKEKDRLEKLNKEMTDELQEKELENDRQYQTIVDLKDELKSLTASAKEMKQNQNGSEELDACRSELEKAKEEIEKARASYDKEKDRLEKLNKEMTDELQEKELENDRQYQTIVDLKDELKSLTASAKEMKQNQNESEELAACRSELEEAKEEIEKAWALYDKEKDRLEKLNRQMTDELQEKELENDRQYQTIVDLKDELKSLTASHKEMKQNQNGSEELAACRSELEKAREEIEKAWALYDKEKDRLEKLNRQMTDELQEKELENDRQYQTIVDLKDELKSLTASQKEMKQNQNGSEELDACRSELEKAKEEIEKAWALYDKEKDRLEKLNRQMTDKLQEKELENDRQYQTIVDLKDELKSLTASHKETKQNNNGSEELAACKSELEKAKEEIDKAWALYDKEKDRLEKINWQMTGKVLICNYSDGLVLSSPSVFGIPDETLALVFHILHEYEQSLASTDRFN